MWFGFCIFQIPMKSLINLVFLISTFCFSQESFNVTQHKEWLLSVDRVIYKDNFGTTYSVTNNVFYKNNGLTNLTYNNLQLGELYSINTFNPLKINLFYKEFNTVVVLDNRLAEIFKINFNTIEPYKNVSHITTGYDNSLWIFNLDLQQLELYDYKSNIVRAQTMPIQTEVLDLKSNYNYCWLLTKNYLYKFNYFGSLISKLPNSGFTSLAENDGSIILNSDNNLLYLKKDSNKIIPLKIPNLLINDFFVINETLYIYDSKILHEFLIKTN